MSGRQARSVVMGRGGIFMLSFLVNKQVNVQTWTLPVSSSHGTQKEQKHLQGPAASRATNSSKSVNPRTRARTEEDETAANKKKE